MEIPYGGIHVLVVRCGCLQVKVRGVYKNGHELPVPISKVDRRGCNPSKRRDHWKCWNSWP